MLLISIHNRYSLVNIKLPLYYVICDINLPTTNDPQLQDSAIVALCDSILEELITCTPHTGVCL